MSALEETLSESMKVEFVNKEETKPVKDSNQGESMVKKQQSYRQKMQAVQARIKYREKLIKGFRQHLQKGTFPKRIKSLRPYPKMSTTESQAMVNVACQQVECVILDQMILEEDIKLKQDQSLCQALKEERQVERARPPRTSIAQLQQELADLQAKYNELC